MTWGMVYLNDDRLMPKYDSPIFTDKEKWEHDKKLFAMTEKAQRELEDAKMKFLANHGLLDFSLGRRYEERG